VTGEETTLLLFIQSYAAGREPDETQEYGPVFHITNNPNDMT
jgi:hypothetical protein